MLRMLIVTAASAAGLVLGSTPGHAQDGYFVGHLATYTGPTSDSGIPYGQGIEDAVDYINEKEGGVAGAALRRDSRDYSYEIPQAMSAYRSWTGGDGGPVVIQGWGTADTEALVRFVARDEIAYMSASYSGHLTDPTGKSSHSPAAAPYNFFVGPTYSDICRAEVQLAKADWEEKGGEGRPGWVHMGANHPYANSPKAACEAYAEELGFEVLPAINYSLSPGDFKGQCLSLEDSGADYAYLANTTGSNVALLKSCATVGVDVQFFTNPWGFDATAVEAAGEASDGMIFYGPVTWGSDAPGMELVREISRMSDPAGERRRLLHYMRGVCSVYFMRDAIAIAAENGEVTGPTVKAALESMRDHVPEGLEGVCLPHTWSAEDHRGTMEVALYRNHYNGGDFEFERLPAVELPRRDEWLGW